jgi:hypothetical protein
MCSNFSLVKKIVSATPITEIKIQRIPTCGFKAKVVLSLKSDSTIATSLLMYRSRKEGTDISVK